MDEPVNPGAGAASLSNVVDYAVFASRRQAKLAASGHIVVEAGPPMLGEDGAREGAALVVEEVALGTGADATFPDDDPARA